MRKGRAKRYESSRGFTLVELLISFAMLAVITTAIFTLLNRGQQSFTSQQRITEVVQQARIAMDQITVYLRSAGNDPEDILASQTPPFGHTHGGLFPIEISGPGHIQINSDVTGSIAGATPLESLGDPDGTLSQRHEKVIIRYDSGASDLFLDIGDGEELLVQNISSFGLTYYDIAGTQIANPAVNEGDIVQVHVALVAETDDPDPASGKLQSITLESDVMLRSQVFGLL